MSKEIPTVKVRVVFEMEIANDIFANKLSIIKTIEKIPKYLNPLFRKDTTKLTWLNKSFVEQQCNLLELPEENIKGIKKLNEDQFPDLEGLLMKKKM